MANKNYCENKSKKPVITKYDPKKNYVVQMVDSLSSIDYPNENHIYVIESTGEKYIFYNGAFSKFASTPLEPLIVSYSGNYTSGDRGAYQYYYCNNVTFDKTYDEVVEAVNQGRPVYLKNGDDIKIFEIEVLEYYVSFSYNSVSRNAENTQHEIENAVLILPNGSTTGTGTRIRIMAHNLVPDTSLSSTSRRPVQNRVVKQAIDAINVFSPLQVNVTVSNITTTGYDYYSVRKSNNVTFSKMYSEIKSALTNGLPVVITYNGRTMTCTALEVDEIPDTITMTVFDIFLDTASKPRYRSESFTIKADNTGSYVWVLVAMNGLDALVGS